MDRKRLSVAVAVFGPAAILTLLAPAGKRFEMGVLPALALLVFVAPLSRTVREFVLHHSRHITIIALGIAAAGLIAIIPAALFATSVKPNWIAAVCSTLIVLGTCAAFTPSLARQMKAAELARKPVEHKHEGFQATSEVKGIVVELFAQIGALVRVAGPWFLTYCLLSLALVATAMLNPVAHVDRTGASWILLGLLVLLFLGNGLLLAAAVQWARFTATMREPALTDIPGRALWGVAWRWAICTSILKFTDDIYPWLEAHLHHAAPWQLDGLERLIGFAALVLVSPFALVFPAVALGAATKGMLGATAGLRVVKSKFYLGAAWILAPYFVVSWLIDLQPVDFKRPAVAALTLIASATAMFATTIVATTYLTRIYLKGAPAAPQEAEQFAE
ncbi:hypothetical protein [Phenylobacterium sp.]|uniref:hypothetical protein n=1 Tax=Phenylobacterium sp. TaxID=1871053 RepID=UPI002735A7D3|nr:hypothetical protein [Phenylobacterium sp.]MDP3660522.1 hypothetical protein [Phenylobacterium sp.]